MIETNRIKEHRERAQLTMAELGAKVGTSKQQISKLEKRERPLTLAWMERIARALDVPVIELLPPYSKAGVPMPAVTLDGATEPAKPPVVPPVATVRTANGFDWQASIPLRETQRMPGSQDVYFKARDVTTVLRPTQLDNARDGYAFYVFDDSMQPRYDPGDLLYVNPHLPANPGRYVVITLHTNAVMVRCFVSWDGESLQARRLHPPEDIVIAAEAVLDVHTIVGCMT